MSTNRLSVPALLFLNGLFALVLVAVPSRAEASSVNCCRKDTSQQHFCCAGCCIGSSNSCEDDADCTIHVD